jgi:outer membrane protein OmpA-like peptidoglycan-associated protein
MNLNLSKQRSNSVKAFFNRMGIQNSEITTVAYGETQPVQPSQSVESDFFDRRVIVRLRDPSKQMLTQSPGDK